MGANEVTAQAVSGQTTGILYRSPFIVFMKGKITLL